MDTLPPLVSDIIWDALASDPRDRRALVRAAPAEFGHAVRFLAMPAFPPTRWSLLSLMTGLVRLDVGEVDLAYLASAGDRLGGCKGVKTFSAKISSKEISDLGRLVPEVCEAVAQAFPAVETLSVMLAVTSPYSLNRATQAIARKLPGLVEVALTLDTTTHREKEHREGEEDEEEDEEDDEDYSKVGSLDTVSVRIAAADDDGIDALHAALSTSGGPSGVVTKIVVLTPSPVYEPTWIYWWSPGDECSRMRELRVPSVTVDVEAVLKIAPSLEILEAFSIHVVSATTDAGAAAAAGAAVASSGVRLKTIEVHGCARDELQFPPTHRTGRLTAYLERISPNSIETYTVVRNERIVFIRRRPGVWSVCYTTAAGLGCVKTVTYVYTAF